MATAKDYVSFLYVHFPVVHQLQQRILYYM